ncbi:hypothetical protein DL765_004170 [Monosporascus sp. GIB2]|nr:hypothetical protein DL765_004170 [Monosporascus sp. GIB2]
MSTDEFHAEFMRASGEVYDRISPESLEKLADLKAALEIADSRDEKIRANILRANLGGDVSLHDRPDFGTGSEAFHACRYYYPPDVEQIAGLVIKGLVPDPKPTQQSITLRPPHAPTVKQLRAYALFPSPGGADFDTFFAHEAKAAIITGFYFDESRYSMPKGPEQSDNI